MHRLRFSGKAITQWYYRRSTNTYQNRDTLEHAMAALDGLRATGRTVGVISHVPELHERIGVQVTVERVDAGRSRVVLPARNGVTAGGEVRTPG